MCGIAAIFKYGQNIETADIPQWIAVANRILWKRGPDGEGTWLSEDGAIGLTHRRLAIIDTTAAGAQPMATPDGRLRIVYNGEIYNYKELRHDLKSRGCRFLSNSDTEVILHLYREEGPDSIRRLRGMYAFALWDESKQGLFLARDPLGIKPLYYSDNGHTIRVASQVKTILAAGGADTSLEPAGHVGYFLWGYVPEPFTLYKGIRSIPAGSTLWIGKADPTIEHRVFYSLPEQLRRAAAKQIPTSEAEAKERLKAALENSVRHHMVSDVPVGLFLSAGLDSTSIAILAARQVTEPLRTFTLGFEQYKGTLMDETVSAERFAKMLHCTHETRWMSIEDFAAELPKIFTSMDQPSIDGINTYFVSMAASETGLKVVLSGLGGDELLGGYPSFSQLPKIVSLIRPLDFLGKPFRVVTAPWLRHFTSPKFAGLLEYGGTLGGAYLLRRGLFMPWELPIILDPDMVREGWRSLDPLINLNKEVGHLSCDHHRVSALETIFYMRNMLLRDTDWAGMAHSLEVRVPLVDVELIDKVAPLMCGPMRPDKKTMIQAAWGQAPEQLLNRPKTCFSFPTREWGVTETTTKGRGLRGWALEVYRQVQRYLPDE
ncbi:MAG: asparagine synthase (glutamine-hydrolyzing) [Desulfosarcina sp.]|nr:asparagine synthase (glutamine-hydrolyzing) [Desulfosarcina sp.]